MDAHLFTKNVTIVFHVVFVFNRLHTIDVKSHFSTKALKVE